MLLPFAMLDMRFLCACGSSFVLKSLTLCSVTASLLLLCDDSLLYNSLLCVPCVCILLQCIRLSSAVVAVCGCVSVNTNKKVLIGIIASNLIFKKKELDFQEGGI